VVKVAEEYTVNEKTVRRDAEYATPTKAPSPSLDALPTIRNGLPLQMLRHAVRPITIIRVVEVAQPLGGGIRAIGAAVLPDGAGKAGARIKGLDKGRGEQSLVEFRGNGRIGFLKGFHCL